jgi:meso-butanediol dehydrogenase/(S,S)-butanediol dehydrogenase/diacetyl reductase
LTSVAVNDVEANSDDLDSVAEEIRQEGRRTVSITTDVSEPEEVEAMVGRVADELGQLNAS